MLRLMICFVFLMAWQGCGGQAGGPERVPVRGQVSYAGEPIQEGKIRFIPEDGPVAVAEIRDGRYVADARGGVPVGRHRVVIEAYRPRAGAEPATAELAEAIADIEEGEVPQEQFLPREYSGAQSTLELVVESGANAITQDFDLE